MGGGCDDQMEGGQSAGSKLEFCEITYGSMGCSVGDERTACVRVDQGVYHPHSPYFFLSFSPVDSVFDIEMR